MAEYHLRHRTPSGYATYASEDGLLLVPPGEGPKYVHTIEGVNLAAAMGLTEQVAHNALPGPPPALNGAPAPVVEAPVEDVDAEPVTERSRREPAFATAPEAAPGRDPQYEPYKEPRDTPLSRWFSWGPGNI